MEGTMTTLTITISDDTDPRVVTALMLLLPDGAEVTHRRATIPGHAALVCSEQCPSGRLLVTTEADAQADDSDVWLFAAMGAADFVVFLPEGVVWLGRLLSGLIPDHLAPGGCAVSPPACHPGTTLRAVQEES
jgi:hypothetical protein